MSTPSRYTVFTKPWPDLSPDELGAFVARMGFDGVELPVRPGYQVDPDNALKMLPLAAETLGKHGVDLVSVAGPCTEAMIRACGEAGRPILRIMVKVPSETDYLSHIERTQREWDALLPVLESSGVTLGVQNHKDRFLTHAMHLYHAVSRYDPKRVGAVWDAAHNAFAGADPELALDVIGSHLCLVNLKNGLWEPDGTGELGVTQWKSRWVAGDEGLCDWPRVVTELKRRGYTGDICLTAEYTVSDVGTVERMVIKDLQLAKRCFGSG
jgi:sugar phosphate isomerase/epimerase